MHASALRWGAVVIVALVAPITACMSGDGPTAVQLSPEILAANTAPVADAGPAVEGREGSLLTFSGAGSVDPDGDALTYRWDFGDGSPLDSGEQVTHEQVTHAYADNGSYTVTLTVSDGTDASTATTTATVSNVAPVVSLVLGADPVPAGSTFTASGSFIDPGADVWMALVDYGDGSRPSFLVLSGKDFSLSNVYATAGTFTITVIVTDDDGGVGVATGEVRVVVVPSNRAPVADAGAATVTGREGGAVRFDGSGSFDPDGDALTYAWDFGDGASARGPTAEHVYADNGTYRVRLTVSDGTLSATAALAAVIDNVAPMVRGFAGAELVPGQVYSAVGSFADPGTDVWSATVDYGDGLGVQSLRLLEKTFALSHTYREAGTFTVTVRVTDDDGGVGIARATVVVRTLQELVARIDQGVKELEASGALNSGNANALSASLDGAIAKLNAGDLDGAINNLDVFINKVEGLVKTDRLTDLEAAPLREEARRVRRIIRALLAG